MTVRLTEPATDWTGHSYEERLRLCAEALFVHGLIKASTYHDTTSRIRARADTQREQDARFPQEIM